MLYDGDVIEKGNRIYRVNFELDDTDESPWERGDGYGIVRKSNDGPQGFKTPGERPMNRAGNREYQYWYDWAKTMRLAKSDGWGLTDEKKAELAKRIGREPTKGEIIAEAVRLDFEFLSGWVNDQWHYIGVIVTDITDDEDAETEYTYALWGIEDCCEDYMEEVAHELVDQAYSLYVSENRFRDPWKNGL